LLEALILPGIKVESKAGVEWQPVKTKISGIVVGSNFVDEKGPGGSVAVGTELDPSVTKSDSLVGNVAGLPGRLPPVHTNLELKTDLFKQILGIRDKLEVEQVKMNEPLMISIATSTTLGVVNQIGNKIKMNIKRPVCAHKGTKVAISRQIKNRWHLIGFGVIE